VFSEWDQIFKNPMTTAAAIDRLVHHSTILEFAVPSYRSERAGKPTEPPSTSKAKTKAQAQQRRHGGRASDVRRATHRSGGVNYNAGAVAVGGHTGLGDRQE